MRNFEKYLRRNWFYLIFPAVFAIISLALVIRNGSFVFEYDFLERFGDQHHYYDLARALAHWDFPKSPYTIGYSLLYIPFILVTGTRDNWTSIMDLLIPIQTFVLVPAYIFAIFKDKSKRDAWIGLGLLSAYYVFLLLKSGDVLIKYTFLGLIPLSEPLAIFCLIMAYYVYLKYVRIAKPRFKYTVILAALLAGGLLTRNTLFMLQLPILLDYLLLKRFLGLSLLGTLVGFFYSPQIIYNYLCSGDPLFNGYVWWANGRVEKNIDNIESVYGIRSRAMFSSRYLLDNASQLVAQYVPLLVMAAINLWNKNRFVVLVIICSLLNLLFHLSYWWSGTGGLLDRFLMPNVMLLLFVFRNNLVKKAARENI